MIIFKKILHTRFKIYWSLKRLTPAPYLTILQVKTSFGAPDRRFEEIFLRQHKSHVKIVTLTHLQILQLEVSGYRKGTF